MTVRSQRQDVTALRHGKPLGPVLRVHAESVGTHFRAFLVLFMSFHAFSRVMTRSEVGTRALHQQPQLQLWLPAWRGGAPERPAEHDAHEAARGLRSLKRLPRLASSSECGEAPPQEAHGTELQAENALLRRQLETHPELYRLSAENRFLREHLGMLVQQKASGEADFYKEDKARRPWVLGKRRRTACGLGF